MTRKPTTPPVWVTCPECGQETLTEWVDVGHGLDDARGAPMIDVKWRLVTKCICEHEMDPSLAD